jgi:hypothetical protein
MIKEKKMNILENYEKLYEDLKIKYENKEKENEQLKTLLKLRDKEIISLKKKIKSANNSIDGIYNNNNIHEISQKYIEELIKIEIENIQKEQLLYRNKILTLENYELQYLAPKLTTGSNHSYQFSSSKLVNKNFNNNNNNIAKVYLSMKYDIKSKNKMYNNRLNKNNSNIENDSLNESLDYKYNTFSSNFREGDNLIFNGSFSKTLTKSKRKFDE